MTVLRLVDNMELRRKQAIQEITTPTEMLLMMVMKTQTETVLSMQMKPILLVEKTLVTLTTTD